MSSNFSNLEYLYNHLPGRVRRDDDGLFLKRYLTFFGVTLDQWDAILDNFYTLIAAATTTGEFAQWWLWSLFGWSWFPSWYTLARQRSLYGNFTYHLARRGTAIGIETFLKEFSINARAFVRPQYFGDFVWGEGGWTITDALGVAVQVYSLNDEVNLDIGTSGFGELVWGEGLYRETTATLTTREIEDLLRWEWPNGQRLMVEYAVFEPVSGPEAWDSQEPVLDETVVPNEVSGIVTEGLD